MDGPLGCSRGQELSKAGSDKPNSKPDRRRQRGIWICMEDCDFQMFAYSLQDSNVTKSTLHDSFYSSACKWSSSQNVDSGRFYDE